MLIPLLPQITCQLNSILACAYHSFYCSANMCRDACLVVGLASVGTADEEVYRGIKNVLLHKQRCGL